MKDIVELFCFNLLVIYLLEDNFDKSILLCQNVFHCGNFLLWEFLYFLLSLSALTAYYCPLIDSRPNLTHLSEPSLICIRFPNMDSDTLTTVSVTIIIIIIQSSPVTNGRQFPVFWMSVSVNDPAGRSLSGSV